VVLFASVCPGKISNMKSVTVLLFLVGSLTGCNHQTGYFHSAEMFTEADRDAVRRVQGSVLGKPPFIRSIIAEYMHEDPPAVSPCNYKVSRVIRRDRALTDGAYAEELHVICLTSTSDFPFRFEWVFDQNQHLSDFKFGYDPEAADYD
jgi:hypothetical protein